MFFVVVFVALFFVNVFVCFYFCSFYFCFLFCFVLWCFFLFFFLHSSYDSITRFLFLMAKGVKTIFIWFGPFVCSNCYVLTFWPGQKCHSRWRTGRKWHILMAVMRGNRVGGNWLMKWDEEKNIPLYSHRLTHQMRVTSELYDSYFHSMTITQAIPKVAEVTHPDRQISEEIAEACPYHRVGVWR